MTCTNHIASALHHKTINLQKYSKNYSNIRVNSFFKKRYVLIREHLTWYLVYK